MKQTLILFLFSLGTLSLTAQIQDVPNGSLQDLAFYIGRNNPKYANADGSRYLNDDFTPAQINVISETQFVRFNVVENAIEIKQNDGTIVSLSQNQVKVIRFKNGSGRIFEVHPFKDQNKKTKTTFFEKLHAGKNYSLFKKERIKFVPAIPEKSSYEPAVSAKFEKSKSILYSSGFSDENLLQAIPLKRKLFLAIFKDKASEIQKYIKSEKLKLSELEDLKKILNFYFKE